jgi:hypothetical protein
MPDSLENGRKAPMTPSEGKKRSQAVIYDALESLGVNVGAIQELNLSPEELDDFYRRIRSLMDEHDRSSNKSRNREVHDVRLYK